MSKETETETENALYDPNWRATETNPSLPKIKEEGEHTGQITLQYSDSENYRLETSSGYTYAPPNVLTRAFQNGYRIRQWTEAKEKTDAIVPGKTRIKFHLIKSEDKPQFLDLVAAKLLD